MIWRLWSSYVTYVLKMMKCNFRLMVLFSMNYLYIAPQPFYQRAVCSPLETLHP